jgi:flagellar FliL protein
VSVAVLTREADVVEGLKTHAPLINNRLVILLSGERFSELQTHQGREQLRQKLLAAVQDILQRELGKPGAEQVLFTNFVMQ